jgi:hypothetical protein
MLILALSLLSYGRKKFAYEPKKRLDGPSRRFQKPFSRCCVLFIIAKQQQYQHYNTYPVFCVCSEAVRTWFHAVFVLPGQAKDLAILCHTGGRLSMKDKGKSTYGETF